MLDIRQVNLSFGEKRILDDFSLTLAQGQTTCLLGPSGCGKTTLMRVASGLLKPDSGQISLPDGAKCSFIFQEDRLLPWFDALTNITVTGVSKDAAMHALDMMQLGSEAHTMPAALSGGMQRRLAIARALAYGGDIFFMDEPLRGLDAATAAPVLAAMGKALAGKTALLITHRPEEALALAQVFLRVQGPPLAVLGTAKSSDFSSVEALSIWLQESSPLSTMPMS